MNELIVIFSFVMGVLSGRIIDNWRSENSDHVNEIARLNAKILEERKDNIRLRTEIKLLRENVMLSVRRFGIQRGQNMGERKL